MARVYEYKRSLDAVTTESDIEKPQFNLGSALICVKEEPCNINNENISIEDNGGGTKYMPNNMSKNDQTVDGLTKTNGKDDALDNISKSMCDNENTVPCPNEKRKSRKRKRPERHSHRDTNDCETMKALQESDDNAISYRRQKRVSVKKQEHKPVHCNICFSEFYSYFALRLHKKSYEKKKKKFLKNVSFGAGRLACNFCPQRFKGKRPIQAHLFHLHQSDLGIVKQNSLTNVPSNSRSHTPKKQTMRQTTLLEYMSSPKKSEYSEIINSLNDSNAYSHAIIKQEIDLNDNDTDLSMNVSSVDTFLQNEIPSQTTTPNQPFVKIHVPSSTMKVLLNIDSKDCLKSPKSSSKNNNSDKLYTLRSLSSSKKLNNEESSMMQKTEPVNIGEKLKNGDLLSKCKKCRVILVRCDDKPTFKSVSQFKTSSTQVIRRNSCISPKRKRQEPRDKNAKTTPTPNTLRNAIPKDSGSTDAILKDLLNTNTPFSKITVRDSHVINNLGKQLAKQESLHEEIAFGAEEKRNAFDPKGLSSEDRRNIKSTQPKMGLKLKELKVSLIRIPKIKQELDMSNIFYCDTCELPFFSKRRKDKHIRKHHVTYISSICTARCNSKRHMLKHYLQAHCTWGCNRCCVCCKFFRSRLSLQKHLLLHCIKIILSKNDKCLNRIRKCNVISKMHKRTANLWPHSMQCKEIADIEQGNVKANNVDNMGNQVDKYKVINDAEAKITNCKEQAFQMNKVNREMQNSFENNVIYLSANNDYETMEPTKEPALDPLNIMNDSFISDNEKLVTSTSNLDTVPSSNDNESVSVVSNIRGNTKHKYPCSICGKQFLKLENLWQHKRTYTQSLQHFCTICGLCFSNRKILRNHINSTHDFYLCNLYKFHCQFCNQGFRSETNLRIHELHYHATVETTDKQKVAELLQVSSVTKNLNTVETMCTVCGRNFNSYERYQLHCMYYHKGHVFACQFCNQIFQGLYMLHHHNKLHHYPESTRDSYKYHCPICYEGFTIETHFQGHMAHVHSNKLIVSINGASTSMKRNYLCSKCYLEFSTIMELMVHVEHYTDGGDYQCRQCDRKCCTLAVLNEHINLSHGDSLRNDYKCNICNEVLISSTSLLCHMKHVHQSLSNSEDSIGDRTLDETAIDPTEFNIRDRVLPVITGLDNELVTSFNPLIRTNTSTSPIKVWGKCNISCPICGVKFDTELYLKEHLTEYLDVGDYKCTRCQRRFANYEILRKHMANHPNPGMPLAKYCCSVCNENFQSSIVYESHVAHLHASIIVTNVPLTNV